MRQITVSKKAANILRANRAMLNDGGSTYIADSDTWIKVDGERFDIRAGDVCVMGTDNRAAHFVVEREAE